MKSVFVTGGSGFVGRNLIKKLTSENIEVFALSRSPESDQPIIEAGATPVPGDIQMQAYYAQTWRVSTPYSTWPPLLTSGSHANNGGTTTLVEQKVLLVNTLDTATGCRGIL